MYACMQLYSCIKLCVLYSYSHICRYTHIIIMCVCIYIYIYIYTHVDVYTYIYIYIYILHAQDMRYDTGACSAVCFSRPSSSWLSADQMTLAGNVSRVDTVVYYTVILYTILE